MTKNYKAPEYDTIYVKYKESSYGGGIREGEENDEWPSYNDTFLEISYDYALLFPPSNKDVFNNWKSVSIYNQENYNKLKECNEVFLAIVVYSTGDTFSHTEGCHEIIGIYPTYKEAQTALDECENKDGYKAWDGYFERLTEKKIDVIRLIK